MSDDVRNAIIRELALGVTSSEVSRKYGYSYRTITRIRKKSNLKGAAHGIGDFREILREAPGKERRALWHELKAQGIDPYGPRILAMIDFGMGVNQIAEEIGCSRMTVSRHAKAAGISIRKLKEERARQIKLATSDKPVRIIKKAQPKPVKPKKQAKVSLPVQPKQWWEV